MIGENANLINRGDYSGDAVEAVPYAGGVLVYLPEDGSWPRTHLAALPTCTRTAHDTNGDEIHDVVLTTKVRCIDVNGDGAIQYGEDGVLLRVVGGEAIQQDGALQCCEVQRAAAIERVRASL